MTDLTRILAHARIPELPNPYYGKVRDCYDLPDDRRILISSDRISAFDRILTSIPFKGQVLTQTARFWFDNTSDICPNHVLDYPDPNVVIGKHLTILPVEIVVRGYLAGTTGTSILTRYKKGERTMYGHDFPDGLKDNQALPAPIITPTSKAFDGGHDEPLTPAEIIEQGLLTAAQWERVSEIALALFARGQQVAAERGLILVDTKYEFGTDAEGNILIADEIHTPDSSRYWLAGISRTRSSRPPRRSISTPTRRSPARPSCPTPRARRRWTACARTWRPTSPSNPDRAAAGTVGARGQPLALPGIFATQRRGGPGR